MPSRLTRLVFRKLLASEPIIHHGCLRRPGLVRQHRLSRPAAATTLPASQRRTFFTNIFKAPERSIRDADLDPGMEKMMEYSKRERLSARLPPVKDVAKAFMDFVNHRYKTMVPVEDAQVQHLLRAFYYLQRQGALDTLSTRFLTKAAPWALARPPKQPSDAHKDLIIGLWEEMQLRSRSQDMGRIPTNVFVTLLQALCGVRATSSARDLLETLHRTTEQDPNVGRMPEEDVDEAVESNDVQHGRGQDSSIAHWLRIIKGFGNEGNEAEMMASMQMMRQYGLDPDVYTVFAILTDFYARKDDVKAARLWFGRMSTATPPPRPGFFSQDMQHSGLESLILMCLRNRELDLGRDAIRYMMAGSPTSGMWNLVFVWAAGTGKGVDEINRMMNVMESSGTNVNTEEPLRVTIATINRLVEFAISRNDPYMAERFINLGNGRGIQADAKTLVLQMDYRLSVNDVDGALTAYKHLQTQDLSENDDVEAVNRLICAMCGTDRHDFESIMNVAADLSDRHARFSPETVSNLATLHLSRGELHDVIDLLNTHVFHYSTSERSSVRDALVDFCLRPASTTAEAWDTYSILRQVFDETDRSQRTQLMADFLRRERPDMAVHVFDHMRMHTRIDTLPTIDTYVAVLRGVAACRDEESLDAVHNQLKLDSGIEPDTRLLNALMLAYTAVERPRRALVFWNDIVSSREGPSLASIHLALRACERAPWGDDKAREIWARLRRTGMEFDAGLWGSYVAGLVGNGDVAGTIKELQAAADQGELVVDAFVIGSMFNAAPGQSKQDDVEVWAKDRYPQRWAELHNIGVHTKNSGVRYFGIDREVEP